MPLHVFYSWQSDTRPATGKHLIAGALRDALAALNADAEIDPADRDDDRLAVLDQDTAGIPGSPPIVETIFAKIGAAAAFVSDLTYVAERRDGRKSPNPNVLFEQGWAWRALTWRAVVSVMNIAHGDPRTHPLPFDLQHARGPIFFDCPDDAPPERRRAERAKLAKELEPRLRAILEDDELRAARRPPVPDAPHPHDLDLVDRWRQTVGDQLKLYLAEHSFGDDHARPRLAPLHSIADTWRGAQFEFDDQVLQTALASFLTANRAFCSLLDERTYVVDRSPDFASPKTDVDRKLGLQRSTLDTIAELNASAARLTDAIDGVDRAIRERIRVPLEGRRLSGDSRGAALAWASGQLDAMAMDRARGGVPALVSRPCLIVRIVPLAAHGNRRLDPRAVAEAQLRFPPDPDARIEESSDARQWWTSAVQVPIPNRNPETAWLVRLVRPGLVEAEVSIGVREDDDDVIPVDGLALERVFVSWTERLAGALGHAGLAGAGIVQLALDGTADVVLRRARFSGKRIGDPSLTLATIEVDDLSARLAPAMHEAFDILWQSAGWRDGSPSFGGGRWTGYEQS